MDFWPENQGQSSLYSKFGTVPGRNYTHNYHERHQATNYPLYYGEQQDQGRESSYWSLPGSRTGGAPQEYTNWTDQELTAPSSHFPFILNRHSQQHQDLGEYQTHEARDREWTASQRAARDYERGFLREAWQRRWEPCSPVRYNREVSTKRSDSSYRELEAWAARYSHSLPRRRRIEAELRGASQGLVESSRAPERDSRSGTDPRVAALQQVLQSANIRESGLWDRGARQQALAYYPSHTPATDTSHTLDIKEKTGYQRGMFSQPPGYIAPPPYNSPHKNLHVLHHFDTNWEQEGKRQTYWSQPTLRKQDISVDQQDHRQAEEENVTNPDRNQKTFPELEGLKHRRQETDALQASSPTSVPETHIQDAGMLSPQQQQVLEAAQIKMINEEASSKVIEGRKFRLSKKTGGMTIFCLVSRMAGTTETPSLPLCTLNTNIQNTGGISKGLKDSSDINPTHKLADEIDFTAATLTEQSNTSDARNLKAKQETSICVGSEMVEDDRSTKAETDDVSPERANTNVADSTSGRQVAQSVQHVSAKYPLWREPSFTSRAESESLSTCLKANNEGESDVLQSQEDAVHPIDVEVRRLDIKKESEDSKGLLVIDTTCVVVKMELIQSPKKDHVHYFGSTPHTEHNPLDIKSTISPEYVQSSSQLDQEVTTDQNAETIPLNINERPEIELDSDLMDKKASGGEGEISFSSSSVPKRETLEERAERILGIPLHDSITEQQPEESATSLLDLFVDDQEVEPSPIKHNNGDDEVEQIPKNPTEEEQSQNQLEVGRKEDAVCLQDDAKGHVMNEGAEDFVGPSEQVSNMSKENDIDSQLKTDNKASPEIEMGKEPLLTFTSEEDTTEQSREGNQPVENYTSSQHPSQCFSPLTLSNSSSLSPSIGCETPNPTLSLMQSSSDLTSLLYISESNTEEGPDPELTALNSTENLGPYPETLSLPHTPPQQLSSPLPLVSTDFSTSSTQPHTVHSPSPSHLDLIAQTAKAGTEDQDENRETLQLINSETSDVVEGLAKDMTEELVSQQQFEFDRPDDVACVKESNIGGEQQKKADEDHTDQILEQALQISQENAVEVNILQLQLQCVQAEDVAKDPIGFLEQTMSQENGPDSQIQTEVNILQQQFDNCQEEDSCLKESYMTEEEEEEEQQQKEADEDPTGLLAQTMSQENDPNSQTQTVVNILQQQFDDSQEDVSCIKERYMTEEQSQKENDEDPTGLLEETTSKQKATDSKTQIKNAVLQDIEPQVQCHPSPPTPSDSDYEGSQPPLDVPSPVKLPSPPSTTYKSDTEYVSLFCPSALNPDTALAAGIAETVPPLHLDSCEESLQFSSSSSFDSPPALLPSCSTPSPQEGSGSVYPDLPLKDPEPQYPKSLWDAVNRIRKHTAPDSENEEEELSEMWDPESVGEDSDFPDVVVDMNSETIVFDEAMQQEISTEGSIEGVDVGQIQQYPCHEELSGHAEEDTLSCSSTSSHSSGDTVIVADEDELEETPPDAGTESKSENEEDFQMAEGERFCSGEVKDETSAKEEEHDGNESIRNESSQSEGCPVEMANLTTKVVEMSQTEQKENEKESFVRSEITDE